MYEGRIQKNQYEVLMKQLVYGETDEVQIRVEEPVYEDFEKALVAAWVRSRPKLTPIKLKKNEVPRKNMKDTFHKSARNELVERSVVYDFFRNLSCAPAGIKF